MLLKCVIQAEYYDGVNKEDTPEQYLCSRNVIYMNVMRRKGKIVIKDEQKENITFDQIIGPNDTPMSGSVDKLTIQIGIVVAVYAVRNLQSLKSRRKYARHDFRLQLFNRYLPRDCIKEHNHGTA